MPWRRAQFKDKEVWAEVDDGGDPVVRRGLVPIRYSKRHDAKIYHGGKDKLTIDAKAPLETFSEEASGGSARAKAERKGGRSGFGSAGTRTAAQAAMAAEAARDLIESLPEDTVLAFTDGSCRGNPGPAGSGAHVRLPGGRSVEASRSLGRATNNVAELTAIALTFELLERAEVDTSARIAVFTDSAYTHGVLIKNWKAKANKELILGLRKRLSDFENLEIFWIAGHVGTEGNERADALANDGVDGVTAVYELPGE